QLVGQVAPEAAHARVLHCMAPLSNRAAAKSRTKHTPQGKAYNQQALQVAASTPIAQYWVNPGAE
ncbi:MAG: hypothetical protein ACREEO_01940, partial [Phenylobacterium sp.]